MSNTNLVYSGADQVEGVTVRRNYLKGLDGIKNINNWAYCTTSVSYSQATGPSGTLSLSGTAGLSLSLTNSGALTSDGCLQLSKASGTNYIGQGITSPLITFDRQDKNQAINISFTYELISGTADVTGTSTQSLEVWLYDTALSTWIQPIGYRNIASIGNGRFNASFQSPPNQDQLRFCIFVNDATTNAFVFNFADFTMSTAPISSAVTKPLIVEAAFSTPTSIAANGIVTYDTIISDTTNGAYNPSTGIFTVPVSGYYRVTSQSNTSSNTDLLLYRNGANYAFFGTATANTVGGGSITVLVNAGDILCVAFDSATTAHGIASGGFLTTLVIELVTASSTGTEGKVIAFKAFLNNNQSIPSLTPTKIAGFTSLYDTAGGFNISSSRYVFPESGIYRMSGCMQVSGTSGDILMGYQINSSGNLILPGTPSGSNTFFRTAATDSFQVNANDYIEFYMYTNPGETLVSGQFSSYVSVEKIAGTPVTQIVPSVSVCYDLYASVSVSANNIVHYDTKFKDTHNAYNMTTGLFTAPIPGEYRISVVNTLNSGGASVYIVKNGTAIGYISASTINLVCSGSRSIPMNSGDTLGVYYDTTSTTIAAGANGSYNNLSIERIGN